MIKDVKKEFEKEFDYLNEGMVLENLWNWIERKLKDYYIKGSNDCDKSYKSVYGESFPHERMVKPTLAEITEAIANKSYVANDVWDCTNGYRRYQLTEVPVIEVKDVIEIIKSKCSL